MNRLFDEFMVPGGETAGAPGPRHPIKTDGCPGMLNCSGWIVCLGPASRLRKSWRRFIDWRLRQTPALKPTGLPRGLEKVFRYHPAANSH
jgi:hypothetical protein